MTIGPVFDIKVCNRSSFIILTNLHCSLVSLVIDCLSSKVPLSLLSKSLKNVVWANLHDRELVIKASIFTSRGSASLILSDFSITTLWNELRLESHEFRLFHIWVSLSTVLNTEGLAFSVWVPVIVSLVVSMMFVERVIQVTINPGELRDMTEKEWHLSVFTILVIVSLSNWV